MGITYAATIMISKASLVLLRTLCRGNTFVQEELFDRLDDLLRIETAVPEVANCVAMVRASVLLPRRTRPV